ncbi:MAG: hypothetical protein CSA22_01170 [Deltaproteobacteria bacterium]|nr:MAG: hypothetical protein CSA22_01170 [Deltaproteobacteria bacterium]
MKMFAGITAKVAIWWMGVILIFNGTFLVLYHNIRQMMTISTRIVERQNTISSTAKRMIETLLEMEEAGRKYALLQTDNYVERFDEGKTRFFNDLITVMALMPADNASARGWKALHDAFQPYKVDLPKNGAAETPARFWISEETLTAWAHSISEMRLANDQRIKASNLELHRRGEWALRSGLVVAFVCMVLAAASILFLYRSIIGPIKTLLKGFQSLSSQQPQQLIAYEKEDEFGRLADAFNALVRRLQREEEMRSDFINMLSHEIRTPLTSISESVSLINEGLMGPVSTRQSRFLTIATKEIERVVALLNHLLEVSSLEKRGVKLEMTPIHPRAFIEDCLSVVASPAMAKKITLDVCVDPQAPSVVADPDRLRQVMINLVDNAIKFSSPGGVVTISAGIVEGQRCFRFSVSDTGPGIASGEDALIFDKYYRSRGVKEHLDGTGLGLTISKQIIDAHGGRLWVESEVGQGSTFYIDLSAADGKRLT